VKKTDTDSNLKASVEKLLLQKSWVWLQVKKQPDDRNIVVINDKFYPLLRLECYVIWVFLRDLGHKILCLIKYENVLLK